MKEQITKIANTIIVSKLNKSLFADELGISRPTLDKRLLTHNWKKSEIEMIKKLR